jgi:hypothetical protein
MLSNHGVKQLDNRDSRVILDREEESNIIIKASQKPDIGLCTFDVFFDNDDVTITSLHVGHAINKIMKM